MKKTFIFYHFSIKFWLFKQFMNLQALISLKKKEKKLKLRILQKLSIHISKSSFFHRHPKCDDHREFTIGWDNSDTSVTAMAPGMELTVFIGYPR